jgi:hypothetical protein
MYEMATVPVLQDDQRNGTTRTVEAETAVVFEKSRPVVERVLVVGYVTGVEASIRLCALPPFVAIDIFDKTDG